MTQSRANAFTLIELLVVVAIIVVLVAILVPALDKAMYISKFAACGAQQHGIGSGINTYAMNNKQRYMRRYAVEQYIGAYSRSTGEWAAKWIFQPGALKFEQKSGPYVEEDGGETRQAPTDDRPLYAEYMGLDLFEDPLSDRCNVDDPRTYQMGRSVSASGDLWWDIYFENNPKMSTMRSSLAWTNVQGQKQTIPLLSGDRSLYRHNFDGAGGGFWFSSHPDLESKLPNIVDQDTDDTISYFWLATWSNLKDAYWDINKYQKSHFDRNFLTADGSVTPYKDITSEINVTTHVAKDDRMNFYPGFPAAADNAPTSIDLDEFSLLPRR